MRKLGLIGGLSWAATESYYRLINEEVQRRAGVNCSPPLIIDSINVCDMLRLTTDEQWAFATEALIASAQRLEAAGATAILICANSMYRVADKIQAAITVPLIGIIDPVGEAMKADGVKTAAILGTSNVMGARWYRQGLVKHGVSLTPAEPDQMALLDTIIYDELMHGEVERASERELKTLLTKFDQNDVDAVALACTELGMIIDTEANVLPIYDSTKLHAYEGVKWILGAMP